MSDKFNQAIIDGIKKIMSQVEISFVAKIISYDNQKMTAEISPLLKKDTQENATAPIVSTPVPNIKDVRIERSPGMRPDYKAGDLVKVVVSANPIDEAIETGLPINIGQHMFNLSFCTITGRVNPKTFTAPSHYSNAGLILSEDPNFYINFKTDQIFFMGKGVFNNNIEVKGNTRSFVTYTELNAALQAFKTAYDAAIGTILSTTTQVGAGGGTGWAAAASAIAIDISAAKTDNVKTGAG